MTATAPAQAEPQVLKAGGTGMALRATARLGEQWSLAAPGRKLEVLPSLGTPGGIAAMLEGAIDIAIASRPPTDEERARGVHTGLCLRTAMVLATSHPAPAGLRIADLPDLFRAAGPSWPDGKPLNIILRSRAGSEIPYFTKLVPGMGAAFDAAFKRSGVPIAATDQENVEIAQRMAGSLAMSSLLQLRAEQIDLRIVAIDGVLPTPETIATGRYPLATSICLLTGPLSSPAAADFLRHISSPAALGLVRSLGADLLP